jgi:hypothetical protein
MNSSTLRLIPKRLSVKDGAFFGAQESVDEQSSLIYFLAYSLG